MVVKAKGAALFLKSNTGTIHFCATEVVLAFWLGKKLWMPLLISIGADLSIGGSGSFVTDTASRASHASGADPLSEE